MTPKVTSFDLHFSYLNKEINFTQYRACLKDLGWTDDEINETLEDQEYDESCTGGRNE